MKFELNEYHKNISKDELLEDLCIVAKKLNKSYLSRSEYEKMANIRQLLILITLVVGWLLAKRLDLELLEIKKTLYIYLTRICSRIWYRYQNY